MYRYLALFAIIGLMAPLVYVLFFTQVVDRMLLRLRLGKRADSLRSTVDALDGAVRTTTHDLHVEQAAVAEVLKTVRSIRTPAEKPPTPDTRTWETHPYVIRMLDDGDLYWANTLGWVSVHDADRFSHAETQTLSLPNGGRWLRQRKSPSRPSKA